MIIDVYKFVTRVVVRCMMLFAVKWYFSIKYSIPLDSYFQKFNSANLITETFMSDKGKRMGKFRLEF